MLNPSPEYVVRAFYSAWIDFDIEHSLEYVSESVLYVMHLEKDLFTFAGTSGDKAGLRARMLDIRRQFDLVEFVPVDINAVGQQVRSLVRCAYRHKPSGEVFDGTFRHAVVVERGLITRMEEFHDADRAAAFMRLANATSQSSTT